jgi:hypothetical protein
VNRRLFSALILFIAIVAAGCRQADGPMPQQGAETNNRLGDLSRDLLAVAGGEATATQDYVDDVKTFAANGQAEQAADRMGRKLADAVKGRPLSEQAARQLAYSSWVIISARELSERQHEAVREDLRTQLTTLGVAQPAVDGVVAEVTATQQIVSTRPRRWYEVF